MARQVDKELLDILKEIYNSIKHISIDGEKGEWARLTDFGEQLSQKGIKPISYGFEKVIHLIKATKLFHAIADSTKTPPVFYIQLKGRRTQPMPQVINKTNQEETKVKDIESLYELSEIGNYYKKLIGDAEISWPVIVGFYEKNDDGSYQISDIRDTLFHEHKYPALFEGDTDRDIVISLDSPLYTLKTNTYYKFNWKIIKADNNRGYIIDVDRSVPAKRIDPQELTANLHQLWDDRAHGTAMNSAMETISSELMASSDGTFIYELLQNANDYPVKDQNDNAIPVEVEFHLTDKCLVCRHSGAPFTPRDVASICHIGYGSKTKNKNAIGYKGIGFKTVFHAHDWVYIKTKHYTFRFDKKHEKEGRPFQIMPVWTTIPELVEIDNTIADLIKEGSKHFNVQTVMLPRKQDYLYGMDKDQESEKSHEYVLRDIFKDIRDIIFIPNIKSVKVFFPGEEPIVCAKGESLDWTISEAYKHELEEEKERKIIVAECLDHPERRIPPKYKTFSDTFVSFAAKRDGNVIIPVENATVNCYLPTKAEFGFPFLMNTDMVPSGDRNQLKLDVKFNQLFANIAGQYFVKWINKLLSEGFTPESVYDLIPDFDKAKTGVGKQYCTFIEEFEKGFKESLNTIPIIPVEGCDELQLPCNVILDVTGFASKRIINQQLFRGITGNEDKYLPIKSLCGNAKLKKILEDCATSVLFNEESLQILFSNDKFKVELAKMSVNTEVLKFLVDYQSKQNYINKELFINHNSGLLVKSSSLFFDIDDDRKLLSSFENQLAFLSTESRKQLEDSSTEDCNYIEKVKSTFTWATYKAYDSVIKPLFETCPTKENNLKLLKSEKVNLNMFSFIVKHGISANIVKSFPLLLADSSWGTLADICFFNNQEAIKIQGQKWIDKTWYKVLSDKYIPETEAEKKKAEDIFAKYNVSKFSKKNLYDKIIKGNKEHIDTINQKTGSDFSACTELLHYLYSIKDEKEIGTFNHFSMPVSGKDGTKDFKTGKDHIIFLITPNTNNNVQSLLSKNWIEQEWGFILDVKCIETMTLYGLDNVTKFIKEKFSIKDSTLANFCKHVVIKNLSSIIAKISPIYKQEEETAEIAKKRLNTENDNFDFFKFVKDNYEHMFADGVNPFHASGYPFVVYNSDNFKKKPAKYYKYSSEAKDASSQSWLPEGLIGVIADRYGNITSGSAIEKQLYLYLKAEDFTYSNFIRADVASNKRSVVEHMNALDLNVSFHSFFKNNREKFVKEELDLLKSYPVFVMNDTAENGVSISMSSTGHHISNQDIENLISSGFATAGSLDIIHKDYFGSKEDDKIYWIEILENKEFSFKEISTWMISTGKDLILKKTVDDKLNVDFWRIVKSITGSTNKDNQKYLLALRAFPIKSKCIKDEKSMTQVLSVNTSCYVSDSYFVGTGGIEYMLEEYAKDSFIVLGDYLENNEDDTITSWKKFWESAGIMSSNEELIMNTIIPNLDKPQNINAKVPLLLYQNRDIINKYLNDSTKPDVIEEIKTYLNKLNIESKGGLSPISKITFIQQNEYAPFSEPMPYLPLWAQIKDYSEDQKKFFKTIGDRAGSKIISTQEAWVVEKIIQVSNSQLSTGINDEEENIISTLSSISQDIHFKFIKDLANWWNISYSIQYSSFVRGIKLYDENNNLCSVSDLTEGTAFKPYCDFQSCGITTPLRYISNKYAEFKGILPLLDDMGIHHTFKQSDIIHLTNINFSRYFWNTYLSDPKNRESVSSMIQEGLFKDVVCVPTEKSVKKAEELYNTFEGNSKENLSSYVNLLKDAEELRANGIYSSFKDAKDESIEYTNPIQSLCFVETLSKDHCFEYLLNAKVDNTAKRRYVLALLLDYYKSNKITEEDLTAYRSSINAKWQNGKKESAHLCGLYAIGRQPEDKFFLRHFGNDPIVINNDTIADDDQSFEEICENILGLQILHGGTNSDFVTKPSEDSINESDRIRRILVQKSLLLSTIINAPEGEEWINAYKQYVERIQLLNFVRCNDITITCKKVSTLSRKNVDDFYFDDSTKTFYYINDWQDKFVFAPMMQKLIEVLKIPGKDDERTIMRILNKDLSMSGVRRMVEDYCVQFFSDDAFIELIKSEYPDAAKYLCLGKVQDQDEEKPENLVGFSQERELLSGEKGKPNTEEKDLPLLDNQTDKKRSAGSENDCQHKKQDKQHTQKPTESPNNKPDNNEYSEDYADSNEFGDFDKPENIDDGTLKEEHSENNMENSEGDQYNTHIFAPDRNDYMGSVDHGKDYQQVEEKAWKLLSRKHPKPFTKEGNERLRSHGTPLELESLEPTERELDLLSQCNISPEQISDTNYLAQLRLYLNLTEEQHEHPLENMEEFIRNADDVTEHKLQDGKYIHTCSAARGVMYIGPTIWNKMVDNKGRVCVFLDGKGKNFAWINDTTEFLKLVEKDDVVIKITGKEKVEVVKALYTGLLKDKIGTAYTLIRVASRTNMDEVFAHYVGAMAEAEDGNEDNNEYGE